MMSIKLVWRNFLRDSILACPCVRPLELTTSETHKQTKLPSCNITQAILASDLKCFCLLAANKYVIHLYQSCRARHLPIFRLLLWLLLRMQNIRLMMHQEQPPHVSLYAQSLLRKCGLADKFLRAGTCRKQYELQNELWWLTDEDHWTCGDCYREIACLFLH